MPGVSELSSPSTGLAGGKHREHALVDALDQIRAALVPAIDATLDDRHVRVASVAATRFVFQVPEAVIASVLGGDERVEGRAGRGNGFRQALEHRTVTHESRKIARRADRGVASYGARPSA